MNIAIEVLSILHTGLAQLNVVLSVLYLDIGQAAALLPFQIDDCLDDTMRQLLCPLRELLAILDSAWCEHPTEMSEHV